MRIKLFCINWKRLSGSAIAWIAVLVYGCTIAFAGTPDWLRAAARSDTSSIAKDSNAVLLLDEKFTAMNADGDMKEVVRRAYKILRPKGEEYGSVAVYYDSETRLDYLRAWSITAGGEEREIKDNDKEEVETTVLSEALYEDIRVRVIRIPNSVPGAVIGYEYAQRHRPRVLQSIWAFQHQVPTKHARFVLQLTSNWAFEIYWRNHQPITATPDPEHRLVWDLENIPALEKEELMPAFRAVAGSVVFAFHRTADSSSSWRDIAAWYANLAADRLQPSPAIKAKVAEILAASGPGARERLQGLTSFVQQNVRYVAIEIGKGGFQPHSAPEIFQNLYGDCKDKVTLLRVMLREAGFESYYVLVNSDRGVVAPEFPSALNFDHVIVAIRLPDSISTEGFYTVQKNADFGRLLFFDPTDYLTPLGYLPSSLQAGFALLVSPAEGQIVQLPLAGASVNRIQRVASLTLGPDGSLSGTVREIRNGAIAIRKKADWREKSNAERKRDVEDFVSSFVGGVRVSELKVEGLDDLNPTLVTDYAFVAPSYAQITGPLMLFRPCVLGQQGSDILEKESRHQSLEFPDAYSYSDLTEIRIPPGFEVDELPTAVESTVPAAEYHTTIEVEPRLVRSTRTLSIKQIHVPLNEIPDVRRLYRQIVDSEHSFIVFNHSSKP